MAGFSIWHLVILLIIVTIVMMPYVLGCILLPAIVRTAGLNRFGAPPPSLPFLDAIVVCMTKYADFHGRASRSEYWWFCFTVGLVEVSLAVMDSGWHAHGLVVLPGLLLVSPLLAVTARRLHDTNRSAGWLWLYPTVLGSIGLMIAAVLPAKGDPSEAVEYPDPSTQGKQRGR